jgi:hypothetical protein
LLGSRMRLLGTLDLRMCFKQRKYRDLVHRQLNGEYKSIVPWEI